MENSADKYIGRILDDRYEIIELIGSGGMANVYKALCHRLNRYDAVKIMRDETAANTELRRRFCAESQAVFVALWIEDTYSMELTYSGETDTDELLRLINTIK